MTAARVKRMPRPVVYPTSDGKPMAETDAHRDGMMDLIGTLRKRYRRRKVYVTGNILVYYEEGNPREVIAPNVWVARGVEPRQRDNYLLWEEAKGPEAAIELTSKSTKREDTGKKFLLYQNVLRVAELFLFDPYDEYLKPRLQGYRLRKSEYASIPFVEGRLPSKILGLHLEAEGVRLRLYDPVAQCYLLTPQEEADLEHAQRQRAEEEWAREQSARVRAEAELACLRREIEELRRDPAEET